MIKIDRGKIGILLIIFAAIIFIIAIYISIPKRQTDQQRIDVELNNEQLKFLIKEMTKYLHSSENINNNTSFTEDEMLNFAFSYMAFLDKDGTNTKIDEENSMGIVSLNAVEEYVTYIFGIEDLNLENISYEIDQDTVYIPLNLQGGDAQVYKYKNTTYNQTTGEYIAYIDCLEVMSAEDLSNLMTKSEYNEEDVVFTLLIKYKVVGNRKILLAYTYESNF